MNKYKDQIFDILINHIHIRATSKVSVHPTSSRGNKYIYMDRQIKQHINTGRERGLVGPSPPLKNIQKPPAPSINK